MNIKEFTELMKDDFDKVSHKDWDNDTQNGICFWDKETRDNHYFNPKPKFPIEFESGCNKNERFSVAENGVILFNNEVTSLCGKCADALYEAIKKSKEIRGRE